jgi:hypothetical protein
MAVDVDVVGAVNVAWAVTGVVLGTAQWAVLHKRVSFGWWLSANAVGWALAGVRGGALTGGGGGIVSEAVNGAITGSVLALLLRRPILESSETDA